MDGIKIDRILERYIDIYIYNGSFCNPGFNDLRISQCDRFFVFFLKTD